MSLLRRAERARRPADTADAGPVAPAGPPARPSQAREQFLQEIRLRLQQEVISASGSFQDVPPTEIRGTMEGIVDRIIGLHGFAVTRDERLRLIEELVDDVTGLGPLEPLLHDETITEVMVNGPRRVYIERGGKIQRVDVAFQSDEHLKLIIDRIISPIGRRIDESSPRVDARLPDGSRVNAVIEPLSLVGPVITI